MSQQSIRTANNPPPTSLVSISPYPGSTVEYRPKKFTQDFGGIRNMVAGWEQQMNSPRSLTPNSPHAGNISSPSNPTISPATPNQQQTASSGKSARNAFFADPYPSPSGSRASNPPPPPQSPLATHTSPRFASVDRLAQRQKIYDQPSGMKSPSPEPKFVILEDDESLNPKRDMYLSREISQNSVNSSPDSTLTSTTLSSTRNTLPANKDLLYSRSRDLARYAIDSTTPTTTTASREKPTAMAAKDADLNVGFSDLPNQIHRKTIKKGFEFTLMVVGESELGKSTLVNSMFLTDIYSDEYPGPSKRLAKTVDVQSTKVNLKEKNVNLSLTIVDTPGFGDSLNNSDSWQKISEYIENRYEEYLNAETKLHRTHIHDNRVHCCLYFILPRVTLRAIDVELMKNLQDKVNIIPIIAKADTLTPDECQQMKKNIMNQIYQHKIKIYEFPDCDDEDDAKLLKQLKARIPFAVCGSNYVVENNSGDRRRARKYPWGSVEIDNLDHCDFIALRMMLIKYFMLDLVDTTNNVHYENYRCRKLAGIGSEKASKDCNMNPLAQMEEERKGSEAKLRKLEQEMDQVFETKVKAKEQKLKEMETEITRFDEQNRKIHEKEIQELSEKRSAFEKERDAFELIVRDMEEMRKNTLEANSREKPDLRRSTSSLSSRKSLNLGFKTMRQMGIWRPQ